MFYFTKNAEMCYQLDYLLEQAKEKNLKKIDLYEAFPEKIEGHIWCKDYGVTERSNCGKSCPLYTPRNGIWGVCTSRGKFYRRGNLVTFLIT